MTTEARRTEDEPVFQQARAPSRDELAGLLDKIIPRLMKMLTHLGLPACLPACGRCLSSRQPDTQGKSGSATGPRSDRKTRVRGGVYNTPRKSECFSAW